MKCDPDADAGVVWLDPVVGRPGRNGIGLRSHEARRSRFGLGAKAGPNKTVSQNRPEAQIARYFCMIPSCEISSGSPLATILPFSRMMHR